MYRHPRERRKYIVVTGSGCSCNTFEAPSLREAEAMTPLGKREVQEQVSKWFNSPGYLMNSGTWAATLERLRSSL